MASNIVSTQNQVIIPQNSTNTTKNDGPNKQKLVSNNPDTINITTSRRVTPKKDNKEKIIGYSLLGVSILAVGFLSFFYRKNIQSFFQNCINKFKSNDSTTEISKDAAESNKKIG